MILAAQWRAVYCGVGVPWGDLTSAGAGMSREAVKEILARAEQEPEFRQIMETNGYVVLEGYDLTEEEIDAAQRWDLPALRRLVGDDAGEDTGSRA